jgi:hypothetical protein
MREERFGSQDACLVPQEDYVSFRPPVHDSVEKEEEYILTFNKR